MKLRNHPLKQPVLIAGSALLGVAALSAATALSPASPMRLSVQPPENPLSFGDGLLTLDVEARVRAEARESNYDFDRSKSDLTDDQWVLSRVRLGALLQACPAFKMYVQLQDSREFGSKRSSNPGRNGAEGDDLVDIRQLWMEFGDAKSHPLTLKLGRQTLTYGDERLVGASEWNNFGRVFDAVKLRWEEKNWSVDLFSASVVSSVPGQFNPSDVFNASETQKGSMLSGIYGSTTAFGPQTTDLYVLHKHEQIAGGVTNFFTFGTRMKSKPGAFSSATSDGKKKPVGFDYSGEFAFQSGKLNKSGVLKDLRAFALNVGSGYTFDVPMTPRAGIAYSYATGDNSEAGKVGTFQNLYPTNHKFYGQMDAFSWQNMHDLELNFKLTPVKNVTLKSELHGFWLANTKDAWYRANGSTAVRTANANANAYAGSELDLTATWNVSKPVALEAGYSRFMAGSYLKDAPTANAGPHSDANFGYLQVKVTF